MPEWEERYYDHRQHVICKRCGVMVGAIAQHIETHDNWHADMALPEWCHDCQSRHMPRKGAT